METKSCQTIVPDSSIPLLFLSTTLLERESKSLSIKKIDNNALYTARYFQLSWRGNCGLYQPTICLKEYLKYILILMWDIKKFLYITNYRRLSNRLAFHQFRSRYNTRRRQSTSIHLKYPCIR